MSAELLPCPFCGGTDIRVQTFSLGTPRVVCQNFMCQATLPGSHSEDEAVRWWNRRAVPPAQGPSERERRAIACLRAYVDACHAQGINLGPLTGDAEEVIASPPPSEPRAWVEVQFSLDFGFYVALVPLGEVGWKVDDFHDDEETAGLVAKAVASAISLPIKSPSRTGEN